MASPLRVLHLEDSPRDAEVIRHRLNAEGVSCEITLVSTKDGFEAALTREPFDVILSDYNLPGYDGISALTYAQRTRPDVPVILISGTVGDEEGVKCLHLGATDYLLKDRLERLASAVERAIQEAEIRRTRSRGEVALAESEARKAAILESALDCIVTMDADGKVIEFNAAAERTFGYAKAEAIGRLLADLIVPARFRDVHNAGLARYLATGDGPRIGKLTEITAVRSDGSESPMELSITALHSGSASIFTGVLRDITARKQAEEEADDLARFPSENPNPVLRIHRDGTLLYSNAGGLRQLPGWNLQTGEMVPIWLRTTVSQVMDSGSSRVVEIEECGRTYSFFFMPVVLADYVNVYGQDITERNQAVEALRTAEERMRFALEAASVGIWDMDCTTRRVRLSEIVQAQYGLQPGTFSGTFEAYIECIHPDDRNSMVEAVEKAMKSGDDFSVPHRARRPDGTVRFLNGTGRFRLDEHGEAVRGVGISQDVTERRALEEQYQQAQKMEAIGRLAAGVAHDFNNLLTVILGFCELLLADLDPADRHRADIAEIEKAGARAAGLTRQLLIFSRKEIIQPTLLDVNVIVADMRVMLGRLIGEDVDVVLALGRAVPPVMADRGQVEQIVLNLAVNARDAMPKGGTLTIETANVEPDECRAKAHFAVAPGACVALTVTDTGTGITPDVRARLFEPFFTTKGIGKGTGLGLATVQSIVTRSGGSVTVDSEVGKGTSFTVYFPQADTAERVIVAPPPAGRPPVGVQTVLVVEDAAGLREVTKRLLERLGYSVLVAANAEKAVQLFDRNPSIDLLLTDVVMPGASGPELVAQLVGRRPTLKVIYMSGYTDEAITEYGVLGPEIAFLHKPFGSEALGRKIRELLDR